MNGHSRNRGLAICLCALVLTVSAGCTNSTSPGANTTGGSPPMGGKAPSSSSGGGVPNSGMMGRTGSGATNYASDGQRIYLTGVGTDGQPISHNAPPVSRGSLMMGGGGCGSCHGTTGRGGVIRMMSGTAIKAPDITYAALIKAGFTDATIRSAIRNGVDESGKPLKAAMPHWQMSDADLIATIAYLKLLGSQ